MKKFLLTAILSFVLLFPALAHPVHVSVINITVDGLFLSITMNSFVTDWETAYFHYHSQQINFKEATAEEMTWFRKQLNGSLQIKVTEEGDPLKLVIDEIEFEDHNMRVKMHADLTKEPPGLFVHNAILTDIFADQTNLLIYQSPEGEKGIKFDYHKRDEELRLR